MQFRDLVRHDDAFDPSVAYALDQHVRAGREIAAKHWRSRPIADNDWCTVVLNHDRPSN